MAFLFGRDGFRLLEGRNEKINLYRLIGIIVIWTSNTNILKGGAMKNLYVLMVLFFLVIVFIPQPVEAGSRYRKSYRTIGNSTFYNDGTSSRDIGSSTFYSNGFSSRRIGNTEFFSDRSTARKIGGTTFYSDGSTSRTIGGTDFYSDGSTGRHIGNSYFYND